LPENRENTLRNTLSDSFKNTLSGLMIYLSTPDTSTHISFALKSIDNNSLMDNVYYSNNEKEKQATGFFIINSDLPGRRVFGLYFKGKIYPLQSIKKAFVKLNDSLIPVEPNVSSNDKPDSSNKQDPKKTDIISPLELNDEGKIIRYMQDGKYGYLKKRNNKRITEPVFDNAEIFPNGWFAKTIAYVGQTKYRVNKKGKITKIN
jgi:hypothetical protein